MSALLALFGGYAEGASKQIDEEKKEEREWLRNTMAMAAKNRAAYQEQLAARKEEYAKTWEAVQAYAGNLTPQQQIAIISNPQIAKEFIDRKGNVDVNTFININADKIPKHISTVQDFIAEQGKPNKAQANSQTLAAMRGQGKSIFGATVSPTEQDYSREAAKYGATADDLLSYQAPRELPQRESYATLTKQATYSVDDDIKLLEESAAYYTKEGDTEKAQSYASQARVLRNFKESLTPEQISYTKRIDRVKGILLTADKNSEEYKSAKVEWDRHLGTIQQEAAARRKGEGGKESSGKIPDARGLVALARKNAQDVINRRFGTDAASVIAYPIDPVTGEPGDPTFKQNSELSRQMKAVHDAAVAHTLSLYKDSNGRPLTADVARAEKMLGYKADEVGAAPAPTPESKPDPQIVQQQAAQAKAKVTTEYNQRIQATTDPKQKAQIIAERDGKLKAIDERVKSLTSK